MENATKGLLIAAAVLVALLVIGIGLIVLDQGDAILDEGSQQVDQMAVSTFNSAFESYENKQAGSKVISLLTKINTNNLKAKNDETIAERGISVVTDVATGLDFTVSDEYVSSQITAIKQSINSGKTYYVAFDYAVTGFINKVAISTTKEGALTLIGNGN